LPRALDTPTVRRAMEVLTMMTQNELERERYQSRVKAERDRISFLEEHATALAERAKAQEERAKAQEERAKALEEHAKALEEHAKALAERDEALAERDEALKGVQQGIQQERREGVEEGKVLGRIHTLQAMLKVPLTPDAELLAMPLAELQARAEALAQQLEAGR
jgi:flagellar biosynthesis/type III secretory pathway protein FliH